MSKSRRISPKLKKFLEERAEVERQHLNYLRECKRAYLEKERAARDRDGITGYDFSTGTAIYSTHGSAATYDSSVTFKYMTLEEAMRPYESVGGYSYVHGTASPRYVVGGPSVVLERIVRIPALSDGAYPEVGMRVVHDGVTFEIERIEIETPSWRPVAVGHAVGDMDTFVAGRLHVRAPLDELQPAKAKEKVA